jgi:hypothetical protein
LRQPSSKDVERRDRRALIERRWQRLSSEAVEIRRMTYAYRKRLLEEDE